MKNSTIGLGSTTLLIASLFGAAVPPAAADTVQWKQIVGLLRAGEGGNPDNPVGVGAGAVSGGGQHWTTTGGDAKVNLTKGAAKFDVRGLVLAGGNRIGTTGGIAQVKGTLVCDVTGAHGDSVLVDTPLVDLSEQGDASFNGDLGPLPAACADGERAFLIRIPAGRWIANGAVRSVEQ